MSTLPAAPPAGGPEPADRTPKQAVAAICRHVMTTLGRPTDFLRVTARQVTTGGYRVNVVAGADPTTARIAHSFFITADEDGTVTGSAPALVRQY